MATFSYLSTRRPLLFPGNGRVVRKNVKINIFTKKDSDHPSRASLHIISFSPSFFFFLFLTFINQYISCSLCSSLFLFLSLLLFNVGISLILLFLFTLFLSQSISPWLTSLFLTHSVSFNISSSVFLFQTISLSFIPLISIILFHTSFLPICFFRCLSSNLTSLVSPF